MKSSVARLKQRVRDDWQALTWKELAVQVAVLGLYAPGIYIQMVLLEGALRAARGIPPISTYLPATITATCLAVMTVGLQLVVIGLFEDHGKRLTLWQAALVWLMLAATVVLVVALYGYGLSPVVFWLGVALVVGIVIQMSHSDPLAEFRSEERPNTARLAENAELVAAGVIDEV